MSKGRHWWPVKRCSTRLRIAGDSIRLSRSASCFAALKLASGEVPVRVDGYTATIHITELDFLAAMFIG